MRWYIYQHFSVSLDLGIVQLRDLVWATKANMAVNRDCIDCTLTKVWGWYVTRQLKPATPTYYLCCFICSSIMKPFPSFTFCRNSVPGAGYHLCRHGNKGDSTRWFDHCIARWEDWQSQHLSPEWYLHRGSSGELQSWQDCQVSNCLPCSLKLQGLEISSFSDRLFTALR